MGQSLGFISLDKTGLSCQEMERGHLVRPPVHSEWAANGVGSHQLGFRIKLEVLDGLVVLHAVFQSQDLVLKLIMQTPMPACCGHYPGAGWSSAQESQGSGS